jgi:flagellar basal body-associated protein FliL
MRARGYPVHGRRIDKKGVRVSLLWIILIVILVLALLGFFSRGYW